MEWKKYKLGEVLEIKNGKDHKELDDGIYPVLGSGGIMRYANAYLYDKPSVLLPRKGSLTNIQYCDTPFWTVDTLYYTEVNEEKASPYYLYRYLSLLDLSGLDSGTGVPSMTFDSYKSIVVSLPCVEVQRKVATVLATLDRKIALNKRINHNLEAMAKQLYDYWFVQFDFPNAEGKPYKSSGGKMVWNEKLKREIPEGWEVNCISDLCEVNSATVCKGELSQIEYLDTGSITRGDIQSTEKYEFTEAPSRARRKVKDLTIVYSSVRPRLLHYGILSRPKENFIVSTGFITLDVRQKHFALLVYYFLTSDTITESLSSIADTAVSSYPSINTEDVTSLHVVLPFEAIAQKFNNIVEPMFRKMSEFRDEINALTKQRDELLPLLMNGQATVNSD